MCVLHCNIAFCWCFGNVSFSSLPPPGLLWSPSVLYSDLSELLLFLYYKNSLKFKNTKVDCILRWSADAFGSSV
jgi:hypothetical protein